MPKFAELEISTQFRVKSPYASMRLTSSIWVKVPAFKWKAPPGWSETTVFDCNASRVQPRGDDYDHVWINSSYDVEVV